MKNIIRKVLQETIELRKNPLFHDIKVSVKPVKGKGNGLFANVNIKRGELILLAKVYMMSDQDWELVKDTAPVKLYKFQWGDEHGIPLGKWKFDFKNLKDKILWKQTEFCKKYCHDGLRLSGFLYVNDIDVNNTANVEDVFNISKKIVGIKALRDIQAGEELIKEYNYDWKEEFQSWRKGILEGLNLPKHRNSDVIQYVKDELRHSYALMRPHGPFPSVKEIICNLNVRLIALYDTKTNTAWISDSFINNIQQQFAAKTESVKPIVIDQLETQFNLNIKQLFDYRYQFMDFVREHN